MRSCAPLAVTEVTTPGMRERGRCSCLVGVFSSYVDQLRPGGASDASGGHSALHGLDGWLGRLHPCLVRGSGAGRRGEPSLNHSRMSHDELPGWPGVDLRVVRQLCDAPTIVDGLVRGYSSVRGTVRPVGEGNAYEIGRMASYPSQV